MPPSNSTNNSRDDLIERFRNEWDGPDVPGLVAFVDTTATEDLQTIADLALVDMELRIGCGQSAHVEDYLAQFPQLSEDPNVIAELIAGEYELSGQECTRQNAAVNSLPESRVLPPNVLDRTSSRLLRRASTGDAESWKLLVSLYGPVVRYWCRKAGLNRADIADVFSETFLAVVRNLPKFERRSGTAKFRAWLKKVTMSKVYDHFKKQGLEPAAVGGSAAMLQMAGIEAAQGGDPSVEDAGDNDSDGALAHSEETFLAQRTLQLVRKEFREKTWQAFYRTAIEGCTSQQAAEELAMTALAVRKAKSRVMRRLKEALGD